jgi:cytochrome c oxidase subunit IV
MIPQLTKALKQVEAVFYWKELALCHRILLPPLRLVDLIARQLSDCARV